MKTNSIKDIKVANATSRRYGAVGPGAILPRLVPNMSTKHDNILDFGAGKYAIHAEALRKDGYKVTAYEFGNNVNTCLHDVDALDKEYDLIYASNVMNVQNSVSILCHTIKELYDSTRVGGKVLINFPASPRKGAYDGMTHKEATILLINKLLEKFNSVEWIDKKSKVFVAIK